MYKALGLKLIVKAQGDLFGFFFWAVNLVLLYALQAKLRLTNQKKKKTKNNNLSIVLACFSSGILVLWWNKIKIK